MKLFGIQHRNSYQIVKLALESLLHMLVGYLHHTHIYIQTHTHIHVCVYMYTHTNFKGHMEDRQRTQKAYIFIIRRH